MMRVLSALLSADPTPSVVDLGSWRASPRPADPFAHAVLGGFHADRIGWAFASGYQAAGRRLVPDLPDGAIFALCATEDGGNHPRAIQTRLDGGRLTGSKRFVTMGPHATALVVIATTGPGEDGRPQLKAAVVSPETTGVTVQPGMELPFVPELPHGSITLEQAVPTRVLPGDGYSDHLKPFRTIEDTHVHAALLGHLVGIGRRSGWPPGEVEALLVLISALAPLSASHRSPASHRLLGGIIAQTAQRVSAAASLPMEDATRARWERDQPLLGIARKARDARLRRARGA